MNNTETLTTSDTQDKINTRVNRRNNTETLTTSDTQDTGQNKHQSTQKGQSRMNNTETLKTSDTQNTGQNKHQSKQNQQHRDTDNIGYTRNRTK